MDSIFRQPTVPRNYFEAKGVIINKNTLENFKDVNKKELLNLHGKKIEEAIALGDSSFCSYFLLLTFCDLKTHNFYYWFAFPAPVQFKIEEYKEPIDLASFWPAEKLDTFTSDYFAVNITKPLFVSIDSSTSNEFSYVTIDEEIPAVDLESIYFCYSDPSTSNEPSWLLRNFLFYLCKNRPVLSDKWINVISIRQHKNGRQLSASKVFKLKLPKSLEQSNAIEWVGWEKNEHGSFGPRLAALEKSMDPRQLARASANLNLKLMKWRLLPDLDLDKMSKTKCLLIGAGTLGCGVARSLIGWGMKEISLVDSGVVHFSNTTRQNLYTYEDALSGTKKKVDAAVQRYIIIDSLKDKMTLSCFF